MKEESIRLKHVFARLHLLSRYIVEYIFILLIKTLFQLEPQLSVSFVHNSVTAFITQFSCTT